jgi:hypothetical protein
MLLELVMKQMKKSGDAVASDGDGASETTGCDFSSQLQQLLPKVKDIALTAKRSGTTVVDDA